MREPESRACVYYAASVGEADVIVSWLEEQGVRAYVKDRLSAETFQAALIVAPRGIEVCVFDIGEAAAARELLSAHQRAHRVGHNVPTSDASVTAVCEECGKTSTFPMTTAGKVQTCPHCREYVDVPEVGER